MNIVFFLSCQIFLGQKLYMLLKGKKNSFLPLNSSKSILTCSPQSLKNYSHTFGPLCKNFFKAILWRKTCQQISLSDMFINKKQVLLNLNFWYGKDSLQCDVIILLNINLILYAMITIFQDGQDFKHAPATSDCSSVFNMIYMYQFNHQGIILKCFTLYKGSS